MRKIFLSTAFLLTLVAGSAFAENFIGVVNFANCITESKYGKSSKTNGFSH